MTHDPRMEDAAAAFLAAYDGTHASVWGAVRAAIDAADATDGHKAELAMARTDADQLRMALRAAERKLAAAAEALRPFATALERYRLAEHDMIYLWNEQFARMNVMPKQFFDRARAAYAEITRVASDDATLRFIEPASTPQSGEETAGKVVGPEGFEPPTRPL